MNGPLRRTGVVALVLFGLLFVNLNWVQGYMADEYRTHPLNGRVQVDEYARARGKIALANGVVVADSKETTDQLKYLRTYPGGPSYAHIVGYKPVNLGATRIERLQNDFLTGNSDLQIAERIAGMVTGERPPAGIVQLTISQRAQETAVKQLNDASGKTRKSAVVALNPQTGALLASVSLPSFDPNSLAAHRADAADAAYKALEGQPDRPLNDRALSERYPAGSTFKVITSAAGMTNSALTPDSTIQGGATYAPPRSGNFVIRNSSGVDCPEQLTLKRALTVSCNTAYSRMGVELGAEKLKAMAEAFGFGAEPKFADDDRNVMGVANSITGEMAGQDGQENPTAVAQSAIGQLDIQMSPLQGALVAATVANGGRQMRPYVVDKLQSADLEVVRQTSPKEARRPIDSSVAAGLQDMMVGVVQDGTGKNARINGLRVGGKTGTAENAEDAQDHGWFIGWAMRGDKPIVAVAVFLENYGKGGSAQAARIAGEVMKAYDAEQGGK